MAKPPTDDMHAWVSDTLSVDPTTYPASSSSGGNISQSDPNANQSTDPGTNQSTDPGTNQSTDPGTNQSTDPGTNQSTDPGTNQSTDPGTNQSTDPGTNQSTNQQSVNPGPSQPTPAAPATPPPAAPAATDADTPPLVPGQSEFGYYFNGCMGKLGLPAPSSLFTTATAVAATVGAIQKAVATYGTEVTLGELIGAGLLSDALLVAGACTATFYAGACVSCAAGAAARTVLDI